MTFKAKSTKEYKRLWTDSCALQLKCVKVMGTCKHKLHETHYYVNPYDKPKDVCNALLHVLDLYTWRAVTGFPSWESHNRKIYKVHCPSKKGTVWELQKVKKIPSKRD